MKQLDELTDVETINKCVSLCLSTWKEGPFRLFIKIFRWESNSKRTTVLCDLFYYAFVYARNNKFTHEQTSAFLSIIKRVHDVCIREWHEIASPPVFAAESIVVPGTPFANMQETYQFFKVLVLKHSLTVRPTQSQHDTHHPLVDVFSETAAQFAYFHAGSDEESDRLHRRHVFSALQNVQISLHSDCQFTPIVIRSWNLFFSSPCL